MYSEAPGDNTAVIAVAVIVSLLVCAVVAGAVVYMMHRSKKRKMVSCDAPKCWYVTQNVIVYSIHVVSELDADWLSFMYVPFQQEQKQEQRRKGRGRK